MGSVGETSTDVVIEGSGTADPSLFDGVRWVHHSGPYKGLSFSFEFRTNDAELGGHVETLLASLRIGGQGPSHVYSLLSLESGSFDLYLGDRRIALLASSGRAVEWLLWDINRAAAAASDGYLLLHAGAVQAGHRAVLLPAPSGGGKSTLVAGLVQRGLGYLSDELIALDGGGSRVLPYPKPISLKAGSFHLFAGLPGQPDPSSRFVDDEWYLRPDDIRPNAIGGPSEPFILIVPNFAAERTTTLTALSSTEAFLALTINSVNLEKHGERGAQTLASVVAQCDAYELVMSNLDEACKLVLNVIGEGVQ
jgi:hypothetical protein